MAVIAHGVRRCGASQTLNADAASAGSSKASATWVHTQTIYARHEAKHANISSSDERRRVGPRQSSHLLPLVLVLAGYVSEQARFQAGFRLTGRPLSGCCTALLLLWLLLLLISRHCTPQTEVDL